jgi:hypothetical protein
MTATVAPTGVQLGYARISTGHQSLDQQVDALTAAGVDPARLYSDKLFTVDRHIGWGGRVRDEVLIDARAVEVCPPNRAAVIICPIDVSAHHVTLRRCEFSTASGESASTIATALGVSRAAVYRVLAEQTAEGD